MGAILSDKKNLLIIAGLIVLAALAYFYFRDAVEVPEGTATLTGELGGGGSASQLTADLVPLILQLQSIKLNRAFFDDSVFKSLRDITIELLRQPVGRPNPFAPVGAETGTLSPDEE
ncbi:MAG: hypothetical protein G01um101472_556 [Parcubacteria group bacterium Gr01-1014_72]|nr:MAG: hypothetical protein G01um101472_556 [Parcubacteria group bacterium Gr01-1014_72]